MIVDAAVALFDAVLVEQAALRKAQALHAREHAPAFNIADLFAPGETVLSGVFRWMLDEWESHGQGAAYRDLFFVTFPEAVIVDADWAGARVQCEVAARDGGRIDLLLETRDQRHAVVVENKPWAEWQKHQLQRYWQDQRCGARPVRAKLIAFVGGVEDAQAHVEQEWARWPEGPAFCPDTVFAYDFGAVATWIDACAAATEPFKVAAVLRDLARYARKQIVAGASLMNNNEAIARAALDRGVDGIRAAYAISVALPDALWLLLTDLATEVNSEVSAAGLSANYWFKQSEGHGIEVDANDGLKLTYVLLGSGDGLTPWVGLDAVSEEVASKASSKFRKSAYRQWWVWDHLPGGLSAAQSSVEAIVSGEAAMIIVSDAQQRLAATEV